MNKLERICRIDPRSIGAEYEYLSVEEIKLVKAHVNEILQNPKQKPSQIQWESAWKEILETKKDSPNYLIGSRFNIEEKGTFRWNKSFIKSDCKSLEYKYLQALLSKLLDNYFCNYDYVVEFGCGTGHNLDFFRKSGDFPYYYSLVLERYYFPISAAVPRTKAILDRYTQSQQTGLKPYISLDLVETTVHINKD